MKNMLHIHVKKHLAGFDMKIDWDVEAKRLAIAGPSGCGKSMTLKMIAGIVTPDEGQIVLNDKILFDSRKKIDMRVQMRHIGYLFQNYALFPTMNVRKNIEAGVRGNKKEAEQIVETMIQMFQLDGLQQHMPGELSGGQQQRVALARIMASQPDIIMLDEPFSALDEYLKEQLWVDMTHFLENYSGMVILVSHSRNEVYRFSQQVMILEDGKTVETGQTRQVFAHPSCLMSAKIAGFQNISKVSCLEGNFYFSDWGLKKKKIIDWLPSFAVCRAEDWHLSKKNSEAVARGAICFKNEEIDSCKYFVRTYQGGQIIWKSNNRNLQVGEECCLELSEECIQLI